MGVGHIVIRLIRNIIKQMLVHIRVYLYIFMRDLSKLSAFCKKSIKLYHGRRVRLIHTTSCTRTYYMKYSSVDSPPLA